MRNFGGMAISKRGYSHAKKDKPCQDASIYVNGRNYAAVIVCDGHGGDKHFRSDLGSKIAVGACVESIDDFVKCIEKRKEKTRLHALLEGYGNYLIFAWRETIKKHYRNNPFLGTEINDFSMETIKELENNPYIAYGSTLILAIVCKENLFIIKLGDGEVRVCTEQGITSPVPNSEEFAFGKTASLCNSTASAHIQSRIIPISTVKSCVISTDGVINSFETEEHFNNFCKTLSDECKENIEEFEKDLGDFLPKLTEQGSGDDVSVAILTIEENNNYKNLFKMLTS